MEIWILTVNYKNTKVTEKLISSLKKCESSNMVKVGVVDNSSTNNSLNHLKKLKQNFSNDFNIVSFKENKYYWPAAKKLIQIMKLKYKNYPDWIMICNNDIAFIDKKFFTKLSNIDKDKFPIIGPDIITDEGQSLNPFMIKPLNKLENLYWWFYFFSYPSSKIVRQLKKIFKLKKVKKSLINRKTVYAVHGAAILFSSKFFKKGGWIDDNFDMYGEELTVAGIAKKLDINITFYPKLKVLHKEHASTKKIDQKLLFEKAKKSHYYALSTYLK